MNNILIGDCRNILPTLETKSVQCVVTSPPYYNLRDYGVNMQIGQEATYQEYIDNLVSVFREVRRVLKDDGTVWLNLGDSYAGSGQGGNLDKNKKLKSMTPLKQTPLAGLKKKDLIGIPWRVAFALQEDGWYLRQDIIWHKPNVMPESVKDRCTKSHEYIFLLSKHKNYYFDAEAIKEPVVSIKGNNKTFRNGGVYTKGQSYFNSKKIEAETHGNKPLGLVIPWVLAGTREGDVILDPFFGSGTVAEAAALLNRNWLGIDINPDYEPLYKQRLALFA